MRAPEIPSWWEGFIKGYLKGTFYPGTRRADFADREGFTEGDYRFFSKGVGRLSEFFTVGRSDLPKNYLNQKDLRSGYLLYFLPVNALKVASLLSQTSPPVPLSSIKERGLTILDIGSGPGTGMLGVMAWLEGSAVSLRLKWILIDQNREALKDAVRIHDEAVKQLRIQSEVETHVADISSGRAPRVGPADLILCLNTLSEIPGRKRLPLVEALLERCRGALLIMEPALQRTTRDLMGLHDEIVQQEIGTVLAPCPHQAACPMLRANKRDWCHTYIEWDRPDWIEKIDRLVGIRKEHLKCSYLLLTPPPLALPPKGEETRWRGGDNIWRVVSGHLNSKGKSELLLCGPGGLPNLQRVTRLDRDRSEANRAFDQVQRGDLVEMQRSARVGRDTLLKIPPRPPLSKGGWGDFLRRGS